MILIWGQRNYGQVDKVGDFCYVATQFGHLWFIPLIPIQTWIVIAGSESGNCFRGVQIPMSGKSILIAWLRAASIIAMPILLILSLVATVGAFEARPTTSLFEALVKWSLLAASIVALVLSYKMSHAGIPRAMQLADHLGVPRLAMLKVVQPDRTEEELATQTEEPQWENRYDFRESKGTEDRFRS
jgi:hypothetical protein